MDGKDEIITFSDVAKLKLGLYIRRTCFYNFMNTKPPEFKIAIIGNYAVGKSSLISRFVNDEVPLNNMTSTINCSYNKVIHDNVILHIWDTAGQEKYFSLTETYLRNVNGVIIVRDVSIDNKNEENTNNNIKLWTKKVTDAIGDVPIVIAMNKVDLVSLNFKTILHGNYECIYTSAKTGKNVSKLFSILVNHMMNTYKKSYSRLNIVKLSDNSKKNYRTRCIC